MGGGWGGGTVEVTGASPTPAAPRRGGFPPRAGARGEQAVEERAQTLAAHGRNSINNNNNNNNNSVATTTFIEPLLDTRPHVLSASRLLACFILAGTPGGKSSFHQ